MRGKTGFVLYNYFGYYMIYIPLGEGTKCAQNRRFKRVLKFDRETIIPSTASPRRTRREDESRFSNSRGFHGEEDAFAATRDSAAGEMPADDLDCIGDRGGHTRGIRQNDSSQRLLRFVVNRTGAPSSVREVAGGRRTSSGLPAAVVWPRNQPRGV